MRSCFGCLTFLALVVVLAVGGIIFAALNFAEPLGGFAIERQTEFPTDIQTVAVDVVNTRVEITDITIENPPEYGDERGFIQIESVIVDYEPTPFESTMQFKEVVVHLGELAYVTNGNGETNLTVFQERLTGPEKPAEEKPAEEEPPPSEEKDPFPYRIDSLRIVVDKVRMADYNKPSPSIREINVNLDLTINDIDELSDITGPVTQAMVAKGLGMLTGVVLQSVLDVSTYTNLVGEGAQKIGEGAGNVLRFGTGQLQNLLGGDGEEEEQPTDPDSQP